MDKNKKKLKFLYPFFFRLFLRIPQLGISALHSACQLGHVSSAELLLRAGLSRDLKSKVDRTPLHLAAQAGQLGQGESKPAIAVVGI